MKVFEDEDKIPIITTPLWEHQINTLEKFKEMLIDNGRKGVGDASIMGSGKTLTSLATIQSLFIYELELWRNKNIVDIHSGFLVLIEKFVLVKIWVEEIVNHTKNFEIVVKTEKSKIEKVKGIKTKKDGSIEIIYVEFDGVIKPNTIMISTLGRMRDYPVKHFWNFVVIDECLSIQNKSTLWTLEALRQISVSKYGVALLSATFFRSRFDKLYYMLKMLNSGLPYNKNYLDTILSENIVVNLPVKTYDWDVIEMKYNLSEEQKEEYDTLKRKKMDSSTLYGKLVGYIKENVNYVNIFENILENELFDKKVLIYATSEKESKLFANELKNVGKYPDISQQHVVVSYDKGTYGLNNLTIFDTILTRPPYPDKLPQMKGRLARPGQVNELLTIVYVYLENTIEENAFLYINDANNFYEDHIVPLAEYYETLVQ